MTARVRGFGFRALAIAAGCLAAAGCARVSAPTTYPVEGTVRVPGVNSAALAGGHVEAVLVGDRRVEARGEIRDDGRFTLETVHAGQPVPGAREGEYEVRIVLSDEDRGSRLRRGQVIPPRFAQYKTSGLTLQVPPAENVSLTVPAR